jgi:hypothetical protein
MREVEGSILVCLNLQDSVPVLGSGHQQEEAVVERFPHGVVSDKSLDFLDVEDQAVVRPLDEFSLDRGLPRVILPQGRMPVTSGSHERTRRGKEPAIPRPRERRMR